MQPGDLIAGRYAIETLAGRGGMAAVYRARDTLTGERVALKALRGEVDAREQERFSREAVVLSRLSHPNVVRYIAHGVTETGERFLVMEWVSGADLNAHLRIAPLGVDAAVTLLLGVAQGLAAVHAAGMVHRDVKPRNLVLADGDPALVRILDFGIARWDEALCAMTRTGNIIGTPGYMAPEQVRGERDLDARVDVFALGCVAYECLAGRPAFDGRGAVSVLARVLFETPPKLRSLRPEAPEALEALTERMLSKDRANRPRDGAEVLALLSEIGAPRTMPSGTPVLHGEALTQREQRICAALLATPTDRSVDVSWRSDLAAIASATGNEARVEALVEGSSLVVLTGDGAASDLAARACRCALALRAMAPSLALSVSTGRGEAEGDRVAGEVVDRAAARLRETLGREDEGRGCVMLDDTTANLLDARFAVRELRDAWVLDGEGDLAEAGRTVLGRPVPFVGRDRELAALSAAYAECVEERVARAVLVTGVAGAGKSRLRREWLARLASAVGGPSAVLLGRGDAMRSGAPYGLLASALRRDGGLREGVSAAEREAALWAWVSSTAPGPEVPRLVAFLGELVGVRSTREDVQLDTARSDARVMTDQVRRAWIDWLRARCDVGPVVIVLEDLHWGDHPSIDLVDAALRTLRDRALLVVALARPEVRTIFPTLWRERAVHEVALGELTRRASERIARAVLGEEAAPTLVARVVERAQGNAFYLEELVRAAGEGRPDAVSESAVAMALARLDALPSEARQCLRAAAVFGRFFWPAGVARLVGAREAVALGARLDDLVRREVVELRSERRFAGHEEYSFCHDLVREAAYASLTDDDRALGHRLALAWLEAEGEGDPDALAEHAARAGDRGRAVALFERAAELAFQASDLDATLSRSGRALDLGASGVARGALRALQAEALRWRGEVDRAMACADEALTLLPVDDPRSFSVRAGLVIEDLRRGETARLPTLIEELGPVTADPARGRARLVSVARVAQQSVLAGQQRAAAPLFAWLASMEARDRGDDPALSAWLREVHAFEAMFDGDPSACARHLDAVVSLRERAGDRRSAAVARMNLGFARIELGDNEGAETALSASARAAEELGLTVLAIDARQNLALAMMRRGAVAEARAMFVEVVAESRAHGLVRSEGTARMYLAEALAESGDCDAAEEAAIGALTMVGTTPPRRAVTLATLAQIRLQRGDARGALDASREAMALLASLGGVDEGEAALRRVHAEALLAAGALDEARVAIDDARSRLLARAARIGDEGERGAFLARVRDNARTLELARAWCDRS